MRRYGNLLMAAGFALLGNPSLYVTHGADAPRSAAIFVSNRADRSLDDKAPAFEDFIASRITGKGFRVISRSACTDALSSLLKNSQQTKADQMLANDASALQLARMLGADYLVTASLGTYGTEKRSFEGNGIKTVTMIHNLRVTYKVLEGAQGGTLAGDTLKVSRSIRFTENSSTESTDIINDLLDEASEKVAESLGTKQVAAVAPAGKMVQFSVNCGMQDLAQMPVSIPDVRLTPDNAVVVEKDKLPVQALNVAVELDGAALGSTPGVFRAAPGLHKIRLRRDGFKDFEGTINVYDGQRLSIALQLTDAGYQRWKDNSAFLLSLENGRKLTDAEVERIKGEAQKLRQSGHKVDITEDTKVNTTEGLKVYKSIY